MKEIMLNIVSEDVSLPATLTLPESLPPRGGVIPLHPADDSSRNQFLFRHLADLLPQHGIAVLRFDRRATPGKGDVPLEAQARDALAAVQLLRTYEGMKDAPVGLWGFSQGAWAAPLAASLSPDVAFLILVSSSGVSPAKQMRYGTAEQLRRAGFDAEALAELAHLRATYEEYLRGDAQRASAQALVDSLAQRPWFPLAYVRRDLPPPGAWEDMDFDPGTILSQVRCPVLLFYGEDDEWIPIDESVSVWRQTTADAGNMAITVVRLPGTSHFPTLHGGRDSDSISPLYTDRLLDWILARLEP